MRAITTFLALALVTFVLPAQAGAPAPCPVADWIPDVQKIDAPLGHYVRVHFHVDAPLAGTFWAAVAWHGATTAVTPPLYYGYAAERAAVVDFLQDADGALLSGPGGFLMYPYGVQLTAASQTVRISEQDADLCGSSAAGTFVELAPGSYTYTVLAGADTPNHGAAMLPRGAIVDAVETGPVRVISEASLDCDAKAHAMALGFTSAALVGCEERFDAAGSAYHGVFSGRFPDAMHDVRWDPAVGATRVVPFFDGGIEPAGTAKLLVPRYVTPAGNPFYVPAPTPGALGSDSGIFGLFADVPA